MTFMTKNLKKMLCVALVFVTLGMAFAGYGSADVKETTAPTEVTEETTAPVTEPAETEAPKQNSNTNKNNQQSNKDKDKTEETQPKETEPKETQPKETQPKETEPPTTEPPKPAETTPPATEAPTEPAPTEHQHSWEMEWYPEEGHYGDHYIVCNCGYGCETVDQWITHSRSFSGEDRLANHGNYGESRDWIVDSPEHYEWHCSCGATSMTQP